MCHFMVFFFKALTSPFTCREMHAYLGTHPDLTTKMPPEEITRQEVFSPDHDIMLVKLKNPSTYPTVKLPKCLPCPKCLQKPRKNKEFLVAGFGCNAIDPVTFEFCEFYIFCNIIVYQVYLLEYEQKTN
ncbi:hypothetical protein INR49_000184 [Caranx melampygus]|nr:hypothetical protein INR49_000184 [Caranx melampygus]